jgi:hypothetical protein
VNRSKAHFTPKSAVWGRWGIALCQCDGCLDSLGSGQPGKRHSGPWAMIYDVSPLYSMGIDGTGQRIAIIGRSAINPADTDRFRSMFGLPRATTE